VIDLRLATRSSLTRKRDLLIILGFAIAVLVVWTTTSIIENTQSTTLSPLVQTQVVPLNPSIDEETLKKIEDRRFFTEEELLNFAIVKATPSGTTAVAPTPATTPRTTPPPASPSAITPSE